MYLRSLSYPDPNTINQFGNICVKNALSSVLEQVVEILIQEGFEELYTDGRKIATNTKGIISQDVRGKK
jgi:hypothetical protein